MNTATQGNGTVRSRIEDVLRTRSATAAQIAEELGMKKSTVSVYMAQLKRRKVVERIGHEWSLRDGVKSGAPQLDVTAVVVNGHVFSASQARAVFHGLNALFGAQ